MQEARIHSVSEITHVIKRTLENSFPYISVKGEVTNVTRASSGHIYFSLKDENALLPCIWYKGQQKDITFDPHTGEVFDTPKPSLAKSLTQGMEMVFTGSLSVYAQRGVYQFVVEKAEEVGKGNLHKAFEELKAKLLKLGWFDNKHKKAIPINPKKVAVLTSPQGAVVHDFCRIANEHGLSSQIRIYPIAVQGQEAAPSIVRAFNKVHEDNWAEVIVLIRGGGSLEDLWAFNEEIVAKAIFDAKIPVITGIGHQVDVSIADFVADAAAATPSHIVPKLWQEKDAYSQQIDEFEAELKFLIMQYLNKKEEKINALSRNLKLLSPQYSLQMKSELLAKTLKQFINASAYFEKKEEQYTKNVQKLLPLYPKTVEEKSKNLEHFLQLLEAHNPYKPLEKGYSLISSAEGKIIESINSIVENQNLNIELQDGKVSLEAINVIKSTGK